MTQGNPFELDYTSANQCVSHDTNACGKYFFVLRLLNRLCSINHTFRLQSLEGRDLDKLCQSVKLFIGIFVFVTLSRKTHTDSGRWVLDTSGPDVLVQTSIDSDILCCHGLLSKLADFLDCSWGTTFELLRVDALGNVDGVIPCHQIGFGST
jgi:hypothetical protein